MRVEPYVNFDGRTQEALDFYSRALGAQVLFKMRFKDSPVPMDPSVVPAEAQDRIMHASFRIGDTTINATDGTCTRHEKIAGTSLSLWVENPADADRCFNALAEGGHVRMPLQKTFFSPRYGMVADRFGLMWMVITQGEGNA